MIEPTRAGGREVKAATAIGLQFRQKGKAAREKEMPHPLRTTIWTACRPTSE